jgi:ABC-2 type transport system permease protein
MQPVNTMLVNSQNELEKLFSKNVTRLAIITAVLLPLLVNLLANKLTIADWMGLPSENIHYSMLDIFIKGVLPIYSFMAAAILFTGEAEKGMLIPVRPISRFELFCSKALAIALMLGLQLVIAWLSLIISGVLFGQRIQLAAAFASLGAFLVSLVPLMVLTGFAILLATLLKSSITAITSMIVLYIVMLILPFVMPGSLYLFPSSYLDWYMGWQGNVSIKWLIETVTYLCSAFALFFTSGCYIFNSKEA